MLNLKRIFITCCLGLTFNFASPAQGNAQEVLQDTFEIVRAEVVNIDKQEERIIPGTEAKSTYQTIKARILEGKQTGKEVTIENDYLNLKKDEKFFLYHGTDAVTGHEMYSVRDIDRRIPTLIFIALFVLVVLLFSGKQGIMSLLSLAGSLLVILYVLIPLLVRGYPPVLTSVLISSVVLFFAIFITHGLNRQSTVALFGTISAIVLTGILAYIAVISTRLSGISSDEAVYLNFNTGGILNFSGLLLGGIMIGIVGVLDDIAVTQAAVVSEIYHSAPHLSRKDVYHRALRVGREHAGALVNTLALAYAGVSLPLLLLFSTSDSSFSSIITQEIFVTEIIRTIVGSIGLILTVPITTFLATYFLKGHHTSNHSHSHIHH